MRTFLVVGGLVLLCGCATSVEKRSATHYWEPTSSNTSQREYNQDNVGCETSSGVDGAAGIVAEAPSFESYRACMIERGYSLQTF